MSTSLKNTSRHQNCNGKSTIVDKSYHALEEGADRDILALFNAMSSSVRYLDDKPFTFGNVDVTRARSVVQKWDPLLQDLINTQGFHSSYLQSKFFDRYISVKEKRLEKTLQRKAAMKFLNANQDGYAIDSYILEHETLVPLITKMQYHMNCFFDVPFMVDEIYNLVGHGPNRTVDVEFVDAYEHFKSKSLNGSIYALQQLMHYLHWDSQLKEELMFLSDDFRSAINNWDLDLLLSCFSGGDGLSAAVISHTVTSFVPKKFDSLRTMCPEATVNAWFSRAVALWITKRLRSYCNIDLATQPEVHKQLAKLGSLYDELNIATVDWSEASDRIWTALVEVLMQYGNCPRWFSFMSNVCRIPTTLVTYRYHGKGKSFIDDEDDSDMMSHRDDILAMDGVQSFTYRPLSLRDDGSVIHWQVDVLIKTSMFATMGNPLTFPLQTLIFWCFLSACTELAADRIGISLDEMSCVSSFGDDGIVDSRAEEEIVYYAPLLNWKLNYSKSFFKGNFKESCGGDFYHGVNIRPVQMKRPPLDRFITDKQNEKRYQAWLYIAANLCNDLLTRLGYSTDPIDNWLRDRFKLWQFGKVCIVPPSYPEGSGLRVDGNATGVGLALCDCMPKVFGKVLKAVPIDVGESPAPLIESLIFDWMHAVRFSPIDRTYHFRCLSNSSPRLAINRDDEFFFYLKNLRNRLIGKKDIYEFKPTLSFFDECRSGNSAVDKEGTIAVKEMYLRNEWSHTQGWV